MKSKGIQVGGFYHDGKIGIREVISIGDTFAQRVIYRILAAKVEQEYSYAEKKVVTTIGTTSECDLTSFAAWAKSHLSEIECRELLVDLTARKLRLPPGEQAFMDSVASECAGPEFIPKAGSTISYVFNETRQARGIEKKGLATVDAGRAGSGGDITLTALGAAWIRIHCQVTA